MSAATHTRRALAAPAEDATEAAAVIALLQPVRVSLRDALWKLDHGQPAKARDLVQRAISTVDQVKRAMGG